MASQTPQNITAHDAPTSRELSDMDRYCLKQALAQAEEGMAAGGIPIGSVVGGFSFSTWLCGAAERSND